MWINRVANILDLNKFNEEAKASIPAIQTAMKFGSDNIRFTVSDDWGSEYDTQLNSFMASYVDANPQDKIPKIIDLAKDPNKHFHSINYILELKQSLIPVRTVVQGEVTQVIWYRTLDAQMKPFDPIVKVNINYNRDDTGFATFRTTTRTWYNRDGSENIEVKNTQKFYFVNKADMIDEGIRRRSLLVKTIKIPALEYLTSVLVPLNITEESAYLRGLQFLDDYKDLFDKFVDNSSTITNPADPNFGKKTIIVSLENNSIDGINGPHNEWLDKAPNALGGSKTIRQWLIEEFSI